MTTTGTTTRTTPALTLPGRLGDPDLVLADDPRSDPRMVAALTPFGLAGAPEPVPVTADTPYEGLLEFARAAEAGFGAAFAALFDGLPTVGGVRSHTEVIEGVDGNEIVLHVHEPESRAGVLPGIVHTHGGGMVLNTAADPSYVRWRDELAVAGLVVVGVEFRNAGGVLGDHPFPAGLNDCASATRWVFENRDELGVSHVVVSGESGGGNLSIATALKANREGWIDHIAGVYAQCPYISGLYADPPAALPSMVENDTYFLSMSLMAPMVTLYDPTGANHTNPLAWPYHASAEDVAGLPPHVVSVNQLDPLRDEGLAYCRTLLEGGVPTISRTVNGTCHAGDCLLRGALPEVFAATIRDIAGFAHSL